jgi:hypothetical protein
MIELSSACHGAIYGLVIEYLSDVKYQKYSHVSDLCF